MKSCLGKFKQLTCCLLLFGGNTLAQNQLKLSLKVLADRTHKIYNQTDSIILESEQNNLLVSVEGQNNRTKQFFCELSDHIATKDTFTAPAQLILKNLAGGSYVLTIRELHPSQASKIRFTIKPLFWQQGWFLPLIYVLILALVAAIVYLFAMYKFRQQIRLQQIRNEIAADLHDDVGTALSSITFLGEMAKSRFEKKPEDIRPILERIMNESREMMQTMRGVVWVINPQNDKAADFFEKVKSFAEAVLSSKKIELIFRVADTDTQQMGLEVQRNLFLIFKESVVNMAKHSGATEASIVIKTEKDYVRIQIKDNGKGFDCQSATDGNGLRNLKNRATQLGGKLDVKSKPGEGTQISLVVPLA